MIGVDSICSENRVPKKSPVVIVFFMAIYLYEFLDTPKYPKSHKKAT